MKKSITTLLTFLSLSTNLFAADWKFVYVDTFDNANNSNNYGLNDKLDERRLYLPNASTNWTRKAGSWYDKPIIREWWSQVNHPVSGLNQLSFHSELSAVMLNIPITPEASGGMEYSISVTTDPVVGNNSDIEFTSIMLHSNKNNRGWVTETNFGFFIKADGGMALFQNGNQKTLSTAFVPPSATYEVQLNIKPGLLQGTINGHPISATLNETVPSTAYLYLGAYFVNSGKVSTFDNLSVKTAKNTNKHIKHFGYYWADSDTFGNHIDNQLISYTNFNFVQSIGGVNATNCPDKSCVLLINNALWLDKPILRADWEAQWANIFNEILNGKHQYIAALYILDEPFLNADTNGNYIPGADPEAYKTVIARIKNDLATIPNANIKQMTVFSEPEVNPSISPDVPFLGNLDYVGFNQYVSVAEFNTKILSTLNHLKQSQGFKPVILVPQTYFAGTTNDIETAKINWMYYDLALNDNYVIGLLNFGLWTGIQPPQVPLTLQVQKLIGKAILN